MDSTKISELQRLIDESSYIVFFGGAGVSVESGIPDFRSVDGLYNQKYKYNPETILSSTFFYGNPKEFYRFYKDKMLCLDNLPNTCHLYLSKLDITSLISLTKDNLWFNYLLKCFNKDVGWIDFEKEISVVIKQFNIFFASNQEYFAFLKDEPLLYYIIQQKVT